MNRKKKRKWMWKKEKKTWKKIRHQGRQEVSWDWKMALKIKALFREFYVIIIVSSIPVPSVTDRLSRK